MGKQRHNCVFQSTDNSQVVPDTQDRWKLTEEQGKLTRRNLRGNKPEL